MKLLIFYLQILLPIPMIILFLKLSLPIYFFLFLFLYIFVYRPYVEYLKLIRNGVISRSEKWKFFIPFYNVIYEIKYFEQLYFKQ